MVGGAVRGGGDVCVGNVDCALRGRMIGIELEYTCTRWIFVILICVSRIITKGQARYFDLYLVDTQE